MQLPVLVQNTEETTITTSIEYCEVAVKATTILANATTSVGTS